MRKLFSLLTGLFRREEASGMFFCFLLEAALGILLLQQPEWARLTLTAAVPVLPALLGLGFLLEYCRGVRRRVYLISGVALLTAAALLYFRPPARLPVWAAGCWAVLAGGVFLVNAFRGRKERLIRLMTFAGGALSVLTGSVFFLFTDRNFWRGADLLGWFFLSLAVFTLAASPPLRRWE